LDFNSAGEVVQYIQGFYAGTPVMEFEIVGVTVTDGYFQDNEVCVEKTSCVSLNAKEQVVDSTEICNGSVIVDFRVNHFIEIIMREKKAMCSVCRKEEG